MNMFLVFRECFAPTARPSSLVGLANAPTAAGGPQFAIGVLASP